MIQQLVDHQEKLTQDLNLQLANTMQENFSQAINMIHATDINSESLPFTQQQNNFSDTTVAFYVVAVLLYQQRIFHVPHYFLHHLR